MSFRVGKSKQEKLRRRYREDRGMRLRGMESAKFSFSARTPFKDAIDTQEHETSSAEFLSAGMPGVSVEPLVLADSGIDGISQYRTYDEAGKLVARIWVESQVEDIPPSETR